MRRRARPLRVAASPPGGRPGCRHIEGLGTFPADTRCTGGGHGEHCTLTRDWPWPSVKQASTGINREPHPPCLDGPEVSDSRTKAAEGHTRQTSHIVSDKKHFRTCMQGKWPFFYLHPWGGGCNNICSLGLVFEDVLSLVAQPSHGTLQALPCITVHEKSCCRGVQLHPVFCNIRGLGRD